MKVRNTIVVPLRLPGNYQPEALPTRPLDTELQVGVLVAPFDRGTNATWTTPVRWVSQSDPFSPIPPENITEIDRIYVNVAEAVAGALPKVFRRLFPRSAMLPNRHCPTCDLVFVITATSLNVVNYKNQPVGVIVRVSMYAVGRNGVTVSSVSGEGIGRQTKALYWSQRTFARGMGEPALRAALEQFFTKLVNDESLKAFIERKGIERARPSDLVTTVAFDDADSFFPNKRLDAGESARLRFTVRNQGIGPAFAVRLRLGMTANGVTLPPETEIGDIPPGGSKEVDVPLSAGVDIETAQQQLRVETTEKRGYGGRPVIMHLATERLKRPTLEIADIRLDDRGSRARGDGDGRASNGETVEAVILVRNSGPGDAVGATLTVSATPAIEVVEPLLNVSTISANAVREIRTLLRVPITFLPADLGLSVRAVESRGAAVSTVAREQRWPLQSKRPQVEIGFRLFDGNSPHSRGNRDGIANNGETLEVALVPINRGTLAARGVRLTLASSIVGLSIQPAAIDVGELPPSAEGAEHRVQLTIPRSLGRDDVLQRCSLTVTIAQTDFPGIDQMIGIPFKAHRPSLVAAVASQSPLIEGKPALFTLDVRNQGPLAAEEVKVDVTCDNTAIELLDAAGTPVRTVQVSVGSIPPDTAVGTIRLRAHVRRNIAALAASVKAIVSQRDFASIAAQTVLTIAKEDVAVISAVPPPAPEVVVRRATAVPATISFQRYRDRSQLADEMVGLTFEVQSQTPVAAVRLEHNHRAIELPQSAEIRTPAGYVWQYEPQVRLEYGTNDFEVVVVTSEGARSSRSMTLNREKPRGKIWLAVVGISSYRESSIVDLAFANEDAAAVHTYYRQLGVPNEQIIELLDEDATLANIKRSLGTELVKRASNPDDTVLIYFAGHGEMEADRSSADADGYSKYLLPHDVNPADLFGSALSMEELSRILQRLRPERVVLMIDSCFSGAAGGRTPFEPSAASRGVITEEFLSRMASTGKGRVILTASGSHEVARESTEMRHGIFTYFLLEGLRGAADADHDGRIDVDELYKFVSQKVSSATRGRQNPMRKSPNVTGILVLGGRLQ